MRALHGYGTVEQRDKPTKTKNERERERESIKEEVLDDVLILYTRREYILHMCIYAHTLRTRDS